MSPDSPLLCSSRPLAYWSVRILAQQLSQVEAIWVEVNIWVIVSTSMLDRTWNIFQIQSTDSHQSERPPKAYVIVFRSPSCHFHETRSTSVTLPGTQS
ncbi:hypothetical protein SeLEV6574_g04852 [Synchytrium endobioticum]|uniref:Uncharacterized protein n=1 Tax=Synchytrium endobioticum TaxID=286115 RepID=A0A507CY45_9FUNG|nr:hypothetical protein SeLEV6574_g04852 [Synchytrium endobioticum]